MKILAQASIIDLKDDPALFEQLKPGNYKSKPERMMVLHFDATTGTVRKTLHLAMKSAGMDITY